ncbi:MAG: 5-formyltetrahydrofolate cyclo-ligase [Alphaproteobacteria bacterium]
MTDTDGFNIAQMKARLRAEAKAARRQAENRQAAALALVRHFEASPWVAAAPGAVVAGYWPIGSEIDCRPLLRRLREAAAAIVLPAVEGIDAPLVFRLWTGEAPAARDRMNMAAPGPEAETAVPGLLLVPLLLVDRAGHRLGYGGGYYDRTLSALRKTGRVTALGLAFDAQLTEKLPAGVDDMTLDGLVTEKGWMRFPDTSRAGG